MRTLLRSSLTCLVAVGLLLASSLPDARAETYFPWLQIGNDAGHSYANAGPSPSTNTPYWTSNTEGIGTVWAVDKGVVVASRADAVVLLAWISTGKH
jgi:hypothetical protein